MVNVMISAMIKGTASFPVLYANSLNQPCISHHALGEAMSRLTVSLANILLSVSETKGAFLGIGSALTNRNNTGFPIFNCSLVARFELTQTSFEPVTRSKSLHV